jgi:hypothetical protein
MRTKGARQDGNRTLWTYMMISMEMGIYYDPSGWNCDVYLKT